MYIKREIGELGEKLAAKYLMQNNRKFLSKC